METARQQRLVRAPKARVAVDARTAEVHAVVALPQRDELGAVLVAAQLVVLARDLQRALDRVAAAVAEHHRGDAVRAHQRHQRGRQLDRARMARAGEGVEERQLVELRDDRVAHRLARMAEVAAPQPGHAVEHLVAVDVPHPAALAAGDDVRPGLAHRLRMRHRVPEILGIGALERVDRVIHRRLPPPRPSRPRRPKSTEHLDGDLTILPCPLRPCRKRSTLARRARSIPSRSAVA